MHAPPHPLPQNLRRTCLVLWLAFALALLLAPGPRIPSTKVSSADTWGHVLLFVPGGWLVGRGLVATAAVSATFGAATEAAQNAVPGRSAEAGDLLADIGGALLGALALRIRTR